MTALVKQPGRRQTRKQYWTSVGGSLITIAAFIAGYILKVDIPPGVEAAAVLVVGNSIGYWVMERA